MRDFWRGFTLAEVLITLTIIGIIAAMTIPSLMTKVQDHGFRSAFLKNYAVIQQAYQKSIRDGIPLFGNPGKNKFVHMSDEYFANPELIKDYFKIAKGPYKHVSGGGDSSNPAINRLYSDNSEELQLKALNGGPLLNNHTGNNLMQGSHAFAFQLTDGTIVAFFTSNSLPYMIYIDVNGAKGPNTAGRDIFFITKVFQNLPTQHQIVPYGAPDSGYGYGTLGQYIPNDCTKDGLGYTCGYEIIKNRNYKIK